MSASAIEIRPLQAIDEYQQAEHLQRLAWNVSGDLEVTPLHVLVTMQKNGGLVLGAFDASRLVGFVCGFIGRSTDGRLKHCSHQMGILPTHRSHGLGQRLKWRQRELVLQQGIDWITWTYDPLETANAHLNIARLGVVCRTYLRNVYGALQDGLNQGLPTDRFQVDWWLASPRVMARREGGASAPRSLAEAVAMGAAISNRVHFSNGLPQPRGWEQATTPLVLVEVPAHFQRLKRLAPESATHWRTTTRDVFESYFENGYTVTNLLRDQVDGHDRCFYLLTGDDAGSHQDV
jgi:predicted GNAT superfamily acetyltransferase